MELQFKARLERSQVESHIKAEIKEHLATIDIQQLVKSSIDSAISNRLETKIEQRLKSGSFLENIVKHVQKRLAADVVLDEVIKTIDMVELQSEISKVIATKLLNNYGQ